MHFRALTKYLEINLKTTHQIIDVHNGMMIMKGSDNFHNNIAPNMVTKQLHDGTRVALNLPYTIDDKMEMKNIPFQLKGAFNHFLEAPTVTALQDITVKLDCKLEQHGKLKTKTNVKKLKKGETITPENACKIQISQNGKIVARKEALK